jgi:hypothetical protein
VRRVDRFIWYAPAMLVGNTAFQDSAGAFYRFEVSEREVTEMRYIYDRLPLAPTFLVCAVIFRAFCSLIDACLSDRSLFPFLRSAVCSLQKIQGLDNVLSGKDVLDSLTEILPASISHARLSDIATKMVEYRMLLPVKELENAPLLFVVSATFYYKYNKVHSLRITSVVCTSQLSSLADSERIASHPLVVSATCSCDRNR